MTKFSIILLVCIAIMIVIGIIVWQNSNGDENNLPLQTQVATPIATVSSTQSSTIIAPASGTSSH